MTFLPTHSTTPATLPSPNSRRAGGVSPLFLLRCIYHSRRTPQIHTVVFKLCTLLIICLTTTSQPTVSAQETTPATNPGPQTEAVTDSDRNAPSSSSEDEIDFNQLTEDDLTALQLHLTTLKSQKGPNHPDVIAWERRYTRLKEAIAARPKEPKRTLTIMVPGRDPNDVASLLHELYGEKTNIAVDKLTGNVLVYVTAKDMKTWTEVQFLLNEIEGTVRRLGVESNGAPAKDQPGFPADEQDATFEREARRLALAIRSAKPDDQARLRQELEKVTEQQFAHRQQRRQQEFESLGQRVARLKATHARREASKAELIKRRIDDLLDTNRDLKWDENGSNVTKPTDSVGSLGKATLPGSNPVATTSSGSQPLQATTQSEQTYDGVPYSQWLKLLETERKLERLAAAMEACSYLAPKGDEQRIVRAIFQGARAFEVGSYSDNAHFRGIAISALMRMPMDTVFEEVLANLRAHTKSDQSRNSLVIELIKGTPNSPYEERQLIDAQLQVRAAELVTELIRNISADVRAEDSILLAAACHVWQTSKRPLEDFPELRTRAMALLARGVNSMSTLTAAARQLNEDWMMVALTLVRSAPETPGLAESLAKQVPHDLRTTSINLRILQLISQLGHRAESVAPELVKTFVSFAKQLETQTLQLADFHGNRGSKTQRDTLNAVNWNDSSLRNQIIETLGDIGGGPDGANLIRQLSAHMPPKRQFSNKLSGELFERVRQAVPKVTHQPASDNQRVSLSDYWIMNGIWTLRGLKSDDSKWKPAIDVAISCGEIAYTHPPRDGSISVTLTTLKDIWYLDSASKKWSSPDVANQHMHAIVLDESTTPRSLTLYANPRTEDWADDKFRLEGIYQLSETELTIQISKQGFPRPTEFTKAVDAPENQLFIKLERKSVEAK